MILTLKCQKDDESWQFRLIGYTRQFCHVGPGPAQGTRHQVMHQHHLGTCWKRKVLGSSSDLAALGWGSERSPAPGAWDVG